MTPVDQHNQQDWKENWKLSLRPTIMYIYITFFMEVELM